MSHHVTGGVDPTGGKGGIIDKFSTGRRRLKENIAQKTGKEAADNSEFEERSQRVADLREKVCIFVLFFPPAALARLLIKEAFLGGAYACMYHSSS